MAQELTFKSWQRSAVFDLNFQGGPGGRLSGKMPITITDTKSPSPPVTGDAPFTLMSAADIAGLKPTAIKHMAPAPFANNAETTKLVHIDLWEPDLPWRYSPEIRDPRHNDAVRPWMVLLVGTAKEIQVKGGIANVAQVVLAEHNLEESHLWAHVQSSGIAGTDISRIISPRGLIGGGLLPQHQYVAVLVPAFNDEGKEMWTWTSATTANTHFGKKGILPAFHSWQFMTAEAGDFETLATAIRSVPGGNVGKAKLYYRRDIEADNLHVDETLEIRGAIASLKQEPDQQAAIDHAIADLDVLNDHLENTVGLPAYGSPWLKDPDAAPIGWARDINDDPRYRGIAGLGVWMGIESQEALVEAAVTQAGALREAGQRIGNLAFGLMAAGSLWNRHLPTDKNERLRILGPMMGRMLATGGGLVLDKVTEKSPLSPALFSSAAQRILRDRTSQTRHLTGANGSISRAEALNEANKIEKLPERVPDGLPHADTIAKEMGIKTLEELFQIDYDLLTKIWREVIEFVDSFFNDYQRTRIELIEAGKEQDIPVMRAEMANALFAKLSELLQARLSENHMGCEGRMMLITIAQSQPGGTDMFFARVLEYEFTKELFIELIWQELCRCVAFRPCEEIIANAHVPDRQTFCNDFIASLSPPPISDKKPVDLDKLSDLLFTALDPRLPDAPGRLRLCARLTGVDCKRLIRPEFEVGLNFPTWELLKDKDVEWLLPGVNSLEKDSVLALQTNPAFIDAFMVGINSQFMSEMRWRDLAVNRTCTPLRMFWGQVNYTTGKRQADIEPLAQWAEFPAEKIGALSHQTIQPVDVIDPANQTGNRLVIVFRSDLFRRYPATLVYLVKPAAGDDVDKLLTDPPELDYPEGDHGTHKFFGPLFVGSITPEITFFSFDVSPEELDKYWLVLDEPPTELRFRNTEPFSTNDSSAVFAKKELDKPTRVARSGSVLEDLANQ